MVFLVAVVHVQSWSGSFSSSSFFNSKSQDLRSQLLKNSFLLLIFFPKVHFVSLSLIFVFKTEISSQKSFFCLKRCSPA